MRLLTEVLIMPICRWVSVTLRLYFIIYPWVLNLVQNNHMGYNRAVYCSHFLGWLGVALRVCSIWGQLQISARIASAGQVSTNLWATFLECVQPLESLISCGRKHAYSKAPVFLLVGSDGTLGGAFRDRSLKSRTPSGSNDYFGCGEGPYFRINQAYRMAETNAEAEAFGLGMLLPHKFIAFARIMTGFLGILFAI